MSSLWLCSALFSVLLSTVLADTPKPWHRSHYPNPQTMPELCGRSKPSFICDPDGLLTVNQANLLDERIAYIRNHTACPCSTHQCSIDGRGYAVGIGLVNKMDTGEYGLHDEDAFVIDKNLNEAMQFAYSFLVRWTKGKEMGHCGENVAVFYSAADNVLFTQTGRTARKVLDDTRLGRISINRRVDFRQGNRNEKTYNALNKMLDDFLAVFNGVYDKENGYDREPTASEVRGSSAIGNHASITTMTIASVLTVLWSSVRA